MGDNYDLEKLFNDQLSEADGTQRTLRIKVADDPVEGYKISDTEIVAGDGTSYYGYIHKDGQYYIMKAVVSGAETTYTYSSGVAGAYAAAWIARATETYQNFADEF